MTESVAAAQVVPEYDACTSSNDTHRLDMGNDQIELRKYGSIQSYPRITYLLLCKSTRISAKYRTFVVSLAESSEFQGNDHLQVHLGPEAYLSMEVSYWIRSGAARVQDNQPGRSLSFARMLLRFGLLQCTSGRNTLADNTSGLSFATQF